MKRIGAALLLCVLFLCACQSKVNHEQESTQHEHVPDGADCQHVQYCADCGEQLAETGEHDYPDTPDAQQDGYSYYECRVCGHVNIINQDGMPVVPVG